MDLNSIMNNSNNGNNKKILIVAGILLIVVVIVFCFFIFSDNKVDENTSDDKIIYETEKESEPIEEEVVENIEQDKTVSVYRCQVDSIRDLSTRYEFDVYINQGEEDKKVVVSADMNTYFIDLKNKKTLSISDIGVGEHLILYGVGNYLTGTLKAKIVGVGQDTSYRFGTLTTISDDFTSGGFQISMSNTNDKLLIKSDCSVVNGISGVPFKGLNLLTQGTKLLYKYNPDFQITDSGNIYTCNELIVIRSEVVE